MKTIINITLVLIFGFISKNTCSQTTFQKIIGQLDACNANSGQKTIDGGFVFGGLFVENPTASLFYSSFYLMRTDSTGNVPWKKKYGVVGDYNSFGITSVQETFDGGFIFTGPAKIDSPFIYNYAALIKTDATGDTLWTKFYNETGSEIGKIVRQTSDSGFILMGVMPNSLTFEYNIFLIRTDRIGNLLWSKSYSTHQEIYPCSMTEADDGGYLIGGEIDDDFFLLKVDSSGNILFSNKYSNPNLEYPNSICKSSNNGCLMVGFTNSYGPALGSVYAILLDSIGVERWAKCYYSTDSCAIEFYNVAPTFDNGFVFTGKYKHYTDFNSGYSDTNYVAIVKVDSAGNISWSRSYGAGTRESNGYYIEQASDQGYIVGGTTNALGPIIASYAYLIKTDSLGHSGCNESVMSVFSMPATGSITNVPLLISIPTMVQGYLNFQVGTIGNDLFLCNPTGIEFPGAEKWTFNIVPNPSSGVIKIELSGEWSNSQLEILNVSGQKVVQVENIMGKECTISTNLTQGVYFVNVFNSQIQKCIKLIVY